MSGVPSAVACRNVSVSYGSSGTNAVDAVSLAVAPGEMVALLGPSGSGKTTLLNAIAGFLPIAAGEIEIAGREVATPQRSQPPELRGIGMVFQHYGLWPHLNALETVAYPLRRAGLSAAEARAEARRFLDQMHIGQLADRRPAELSGGEQQRVGVARALARKPAIFLLDEPTAHLDTALRTELQDELAERRRADGAAALMATHDIEEALGLADRVVLLRDGRVIQTGTPTEVYERPVDAWAARMTGPVSIVDGSRLVRPDWVAFDGTIDATVEAVRFGGTHTDYRLATSAGAIQLREAGPPRHALGSAVTCRVNRAWPLDGSVR